MKVISPGPDLKAQQNTKLSSHPEVLSALFLALKAQLNSSSWIDFLGSFKEKTGLLISYQTLQAMAPRYRHATAPPVELCYMLGKSGLFTFPNGEPVTFASFYEVYFGDRDINGNLSEG